MLRLTALAASALVRRVLGNTCTACEEDTNGKASGNSATAMGRYTTASGFYGATAMGASTTAAGTVSLAMGYSTFAGGGADCPKD